MKEPVLTTPKYEKFLDLLQFSPKVKEFSRNSFAIGFGIGFVKGWRLILLTLYDVVLTDEKVERIFQVEAAFKEGGYRAVIDKLHEFVPAEAIDLVLAVIDATEESMYASSPTANELFKKEKCREERQNKKTPINT